jgi:hypothetical protein
MNELMGCIVREVMNVYGPPKISGQNALTEISRVHPALALVLSTADQRVLTMPTTYSSIDAINAKAVNKQQIINSPSHSIDWYHLRPNAELYHKPITRP